LPGLRGSLAGERRPRRDRFRRAAPVDAAAPCCEKRFARTIRRLLAPLLLAATVAVLAASGAEAQIRWRKIAGNLAPDGRTTRLQSFQ
jgi:hypothetical protein